jgi:tRNA modification GTPase
MGVERALKAMEGADICVVVIDSSLRAGGSIEEDLGIVSAVSKPAVLALNKSDLPAAPRETETLCSGKFARPMRTVKTSALRGDGITEMKDAIFELAIGSASIEEGYAATERMVDAIKKAVRYIDDAETALRNSAGVDVAGSMLAEASDAIAAQLGADAGEELLDSIFSTFCVGK